MATILCVDDEPSVGVVLEHTLVKLGHRPVLVDTVEQAMQEVARGPIDLVIADYRMPQHTGIDLIRLLEGEGYKLPVIIMTAFSSVETAVEALKSGAYDYLTKPLDFDELRLTMERAMEHVHLKEENRLLRESLGGHFDRRNLIGRSQAMARLLETVAQVSPTEATVLITGESGTGKEMIAGAIHFNSPRKEAPFVKINCAAITETLLESELFGYEKGAFTGAYKRKEGRFLQAHRGTLFLDEVSEMSSAMQVKLLRVLQEREFTRVGGEELIRVDVRVIAATNKDLLKEIEIGRFREDLYYRLNVVTLVLPPLRQRREDIPLLAQHFLAVFSEKNRKKIKGFTPQAMDWLLKHEWPGNVRELMNAVERGVVLARTDYLDTADLLVLSQDAVKPLFMETPPGGLPLDEVEKATILNALEITGGNKSEAARRLGITRKTLHTKLKKYGVASESPAKGE